jgi:hypothetical protein
MTFKQNNKCELIKWIKSSQGFIMQVDESTDITSLSVLLACHHHQALAVKKILNALKMVLEKFVKIVNIIKPSTTNSRIFSVLCDKIHSSNTMLLLHTEVQWLS